MDVGPFHVGPSEVIVASLLGVLVASLIASALVLLLWGVALLVVTPTMAAISKPVGRRRRHNWLRDQWLTIEPSEPDLHDNARPRPPVCGVTVTCNVDAGAHLDLLAAQVEPHALDAPGSEPTSSAGSEPSDRSMAIYHGRVRPSCRLNLPPHPRGNVAVIVLAGEGTVGVEQLPVRAGQTAVFGPDAAITVTADESERTSSLDVLVLSQPGADTAARGEVTVVQRSAELQTRLRMLKTLIDTPVTAQRPATPPLEQRAVPAA